MLMMKTVRKWSRYRSECDDGGAMREDELMMIKTALESRVDVVFFW